MWVFGYGSLIWSPGFSYRECRVGHIRGYSRRFWQGNDFHRGNAKNIGRVATIIEDKEGITWGRAFLLGEEAEASLSYLDSRETKLGGYTTTIVTFHPRDPNDTPKHVLLYVAQSDSRLYMGPSPLSDVATQISEAAGACGHNAEYLFRLAEFMRDQVPDFWDEHLYHLEHLVRARLKEKQIPIEDVMGNENYEISSVAAGGLDNNSSSSSSSSDDETQSRSPPFASLLPSRKLRCLDL